MYVILYSITSTSVSTIMETLNKSLKPTLKMKKMLKIIKYKIIKSSKDYIDLSGSATPTDSEK